MRIRKQLLAVVAFGFALAMGGSVAAQDSSETGTVEGTVEGDEENFARTVVYLEDVPGDFDPPEDPAVIDQKNQKFVPKVLPILVGTTVDFENSDNTGHNVMSPDGEGYDLGVWGKGETRSHTFESTGVYTQLCRLHPSMVGYVVVLANPYFSKVADDGSFQIEDVPAGTYELTGWSEREDPETIEVTVEAGESTEAALTLE